MRELLSKLPKIDRILKEKVFAHHNITLLKKIIQTYIEMLRQNALRGMACPDYEIIVNEISNIYRKTLSPTLTPLINATGVITQTNLGRSIFSPDLIKEITPLLCEYNNLEYNLEKGERGERYQHISVLISALFDCEDSIVVNNNASAVLLIINTFAKDKEVIISRGELVEIGGSFRIPEVITSAGGILKEVGSTNKTHLNDYTNAISQESTMVAKIHQSNFKQIGFTEQVPYEDIIKLAKKNNLIDYYDVGSGYIEGINTRSEPSLIDIAKNKPSLVSFSGDKLLGGPQAGIIFGKKNLIDKLKKNHLLRALRVDKFTIFALQATLRAYLEQNTKTIPTIAMFNQSQEELLKKSQSLLTLLTKISNLRCEITPLSSKAGAGSLPQEDFPSYGIALYHSKIKTQILNEKIRQRGLIARIQSEKILLDMRCLSPTKFSQIYDIFLQIDIEDAK
ncbi:L-seryl-tRNA(Sec) selenium transferase [Helicobacter sp. 13S00482-2]|uniref:L-seryl-tRNA(Sec) selenium transferase n=1 Tax=Helicobacter sp. 13S00482-2 TaxID=1476200 RepID=UPI000BA62517|nr:L-seryl-tRNA(Sec) selenium transferase [Helicobacter sp. 13S00482-2]PAF54141.1 L-seryl-tRNA(Sec) selenium transferase [Helicobacter sp. 13S00482-2]